jgi:hypothetical protein
MPTTRDVRAYEEDRRMMRSGIAEVLRMMAARLDDGEGGEISIDVDYGRSPDSPAPVTTVKFWLPPTPLRRSRPAKTPIRRAASRAA